MRREIATVEGNNSLFTPTPNSIIKDAQEQARALMDVVEQQHLYQILKGKKFLNVEAWQLVASFTGLSATVEYSKPLDIEDDLGYEARAIVKDKDGIEVSAGESECRQSERGKQQHSHNQLRSMAQTRAISKALRNKLAFIAVMAGFSPTTAEEIDEPPEAPPLSKQPSPEAPPPVDLYKPESPNKVTVADFAQYKEQCLGYVDEDTMNKLASNLKLDGKRIVELKKTELDDLLAACMDFKARQDTEKAESERNAHTASEEEEGIPPFIIDEGEETDVEQTAFNESEE